MCQDLNAARFAESAGAPQEMPLGCIPMDMSRNFEDLWCARDWCRSNQKRSIEVRL